MNNSYSKFMELDSISAPAFWVYDSGELKHRLGFQKHLLEKKIDNFDASRTAMDMILENFLVVYDCGNLKYKIVYND